MRSLGRGFTLVELLVVMAVLGILAMMAFPLAEVSVERDREQELRRGLWEIRDAIDAYKKAVDAGTIPTVAGASGYPPNLLALTAGIANPKASGQAQFFLRRVPRDPFAEEGVPAEASWGLRSYASPPDDPQPGADVYDVYSRSNRLGLNGVALKDW